jgi:hypothetical protein
MCSNFLGGEVNVPAGGLSVAVRRPPSKLDLKKAAVSKAISPSTEWKKME